MPVSGGTAVVVRSEGCERHGDTHGFNRPRRQHPGLCKPRKHPRRLTEPTLGGFTVELNHFPSGILPACIPDRDVDVHKLPGFDALGAQAYKLAFEPGIGEPGAKGVLNRVRLEGLEVPIAHIDVLGIAVEFRAAKIGRRRVIRQPVGNRVGQSSTGRDGTREHIGQGVPALHAARPAVEHRLDRLLPVNGFEPGHVDDVRGVEDNDDLGEVGRDRGDHGRFQLRQAVAAGHVGIVLVLSGGATNEYNRLARNRCCLTDNIVGERHLVLKPGLGCPSAAAVVEGMRRNPGFVDGH